MLCRSTSTGVLSSLLPTVSYSLQTGFTSLSDYTERSAPDVYQHHHHAQLSTPRSSFQSPAFQQLKPGGDVIRSTDGRDWDFGGEAGTSGAGCRTPGRFPNVQSENDIQSLWRSSSWSVSNVAAAGSFNSAASLGRYEETRDQLVTLERLASERESAILEMSENSEDVTSIDSEVSEELREMPSIVNHDSFWNGNATMGGKQHTGQSGQDKSPVSGSHQDSMMEENKHSASSSQDFFSTTVAQSSCSSANGKASRGSAKLFDECYLHSGLQETSGMMRGRSASKAEASPRGLVFERSGCASSSSSQDEVRGPMFITDIGFGNGDGGSGRGGVSGGRGGGGGGYGDSNGIEAHYRRMLEADPGHPLILRNYARFLHEVKRDALKAEPYYERAILANPGDGEVLGEYAQLIWEVYKDEDRAGGYFDQALQTCPDDCYLNAAYASFLWSSERDEEVVEFGKCSQQNKTRAKQTNRLFRHRLGTTDVDSFTGLTKFSGLHVVVSSP